MTVYDIIKQYAGKSEQEQKEAFITSLWDVADVDCNLDVMGYDPDALPKDVKLRCLDNALEYGETDSEVREELQNLLQQELDKVGAKPKQN